MTKFVRFKALRIVAGGILCAGLVAGSLTAAEPERRSITDEELWQIRPPNMFKLSESAKPSVCNPLLASLNEIWAVETGPNRPHPLLWSKFIVDAWRAQTFPWHPRPGAETMNLSWEAAFVDFDGDGSIDGLFRQRTMLRGNEYHNVWFTESARKEIIKSQTLDERTARTILNKENYFPISRVSIEVVRIAGQSFIIVANAYYWAYEDSPRYPSVQLLKRTSKTFKRVCLFDGQVEIIRPR